MQAKQNKELIHYFPLAGRCSATSWTAGPQHVYQLPGKTNTIITNIQPPSFFPWAEHDVIWYGISRWSVWVNCLGYVHSQPLAHPQPTDFWEDGSERSESLDTAGHRLMCCACCPTKLHIYTIKNKSSNVHEIIPRISRLIILIRVLQTLLRKG